MKETDYKFWYIRRDDDGWITEVAVKFYEGITLPLPELDINGNTSQVLRYRREKILSKIDLSHLGNIKSIVDSKGNECVLYTQDDFGNIKTDEEIRLFMNGELKKDTGRKPIKEQK